MKEFSDVPVWRRLLPLGFVFALAMTLTGCPYGSDLDNLEEHVAAGEGCEAALEILAKGCADSSICHGGPNASGSVDLISPGFEATLLQATATYANATGIEKCPQPPVPLIDQQDPYNSWLLKKVRGENMGCGDPMPDFDGLEPIQAECLAKWVTQLVDKGAP